MNPTVTATKLIVLAATSIVFASQAHAAVLLATNFDSASISGSNFTTFTWTGDSHLAGSSVVGVSTGGNATAADGAGRIGSQTDIKNATFDYVYPITINLSNIGDTVTFSSVELLAFSTTSAGVIQTSSKANFTYSATLSTVGGGTTYATQLLNIGTIPANNSGGTAFNIVFATPATIGSSQLGGVSGTIELVLRATSTQATYTQYDNLNINGTYTTVPEPRAALIGGLGLLALLRRRR